MLNVAHMKPKQHEINRNKSKSNRTREFLCIVTFKLDACAQGLGPDVEIEAVEPGKPQRIMYVLYFF